jgi:hypothetical protein
MSEEAAATVRALMAGVALLAIIFTLAFIKSRPPCIQIADSLILAGYCD